MAFTNVQRSPKDLPDQNLSSTTSLDLLTAIAGKLGEHDFAAEMRYVFGQDIPDHTFRALWSHLMRGDMDNPPIILTEFLGYEADYDNRERVIRIDWGFFSSTIRDSQNHWWLLSALLHEFGHHVDNVLRQDLGERTKDGNLTLKQDAPHEEGHRFTKWLLNFATPDQDLIHIGTYSSDASPQRETDVFVPWSTAHAQIRSQQSSIDDTLDSASAGSDRERFEAGAGSDQHFTHLQIGSVMSQFGLEAYEFHSIYFGNWLRDHSQLIDPKIVRAATTPKGAPDIFSREALTQIADVLSIKQFTRMREQLPREFQVSPARLGVYRPSEHIDNPKTTDRNSPDPASRDPEFEPLVFEGDPLLDVDYDSSIKRYIMRSVDFMSTELQKAMQARSFQGYRAFGSALHVLEDFFAHSNFVELALIKNGYSDVLPWTSPADCKAGLPLVTGTFGASDTIASLIGPLGEILFSANDITYQPAKPGDRSEREKILCILLGEYQNPRYLEIYESFLNARDEWTALPFVEFFQRCALYLQGLSAVVGNATGIVMKDLLKQFGENIDDWQTRYGQDPHENGSTDPTHSQLAKDHAEHPLHLIAGTLAADAVKNVVEAMTAYWDGDKGADPVAIARSYFKHPQDTDWQDQTVADWAVAHPENVRRSASKTELISISRQLSHSGRKALDQMEKDGVAYLNFLRGEVKDPSSPFWFIVNLTPQGSILQTALNATGFFGKNAN